LGSGENLWPGEKRSNFCQSSGERKGKDRVWATLASEREKRSMPKYYQKKGKKQTRKRRGVYVPHRKEGGKDIKRIQEVIPYAKEGSGLASPGQYEKMLENSARGGGFSA